MKVVNVFVECWKFDENAIIYLDMDKPDDVAFYNFLFCLLNP